MSNKIISSLLLAGLYAQAHEIFATDSVALSEMVVTATRTDTPKDQLSAATTVYTRADIERRQIKTFPELLRGTTGLDMTQSGGDGQTTSIFMRGTNSDHILVLVDGIKVGSATAGTTPYEFVPIDQIERVEIIRGPQSSLYGSEAIGGVIQIFTRKGGDSETPHYSLSAGAGSYDTYKVGGQVNGKWLDNWYSLGVSSLGTEASMPGSQSQARSALANPTETAMRTRHSMPGSDIILIIMLNWKPLLSVPKVRTNTIQDLVATTRIF